MPALVLTVESNAAVSAQRETVMTKKAVVWLILAATGGAAGVYLLGISLGWYGELEGPGNIEAQSLPAERLEERQQRQQAAALEIGAGNPKQVLFGDLHVHTTYSSDAFRMTLPMVQGEGAHPPADACDFARVCSALDFWALTDHAESLTPEHWTDVKESIRQCNAVTGNPENPDVVAFTGFEWTQAGTTPAEHYGHKNVIFKSIQDSELPTRPIGSNYRDVFRSIPLNLRMLPPLRDPANRQRYYDFDRLIRAVASVPACPEGVDVRALPPDCAETAPTPQDLFEKLGQWGFESIVIPHGTTWGIYSPAGSSLDKQLAAGFHDPARQILIEIFSGHGNSEEYRDWAAVEFEPDGTVSCPEPTADYLPSCWRAGQIIEDRCLAGGFDAAECTERATEARKQYLQLGNMGWHSVPGNRLEDWLDSGQCRDCYLPAFNYRPGGSAQYGLAITNFAAPAGAPHRFRFGFAASSDNHSARPGTGYKETKRGVMTDWWGYRDEASRNVFSTDRGDPQPQTEAVDPTKIDGFNLLELERQASYFVTGGLVATHAEERNRDAVWNAMQRKEVYGTSGERILLWFDLLNAPGEDGPVSLPMGAETAMDETPAFRVRAIGAFEQNPGCPEESRSAMSAARVDRLCRGECYNPSDRRKLITRIDVIRIRPQHRQAEAVSELIEDPWRSFSCEANPSGCVVEFEDEDFAGSDRDTVYYVRAIQKPSPTINAGGLRCDIDARGQCTQVNACYGDDRTVADDDCLAEEEGRAWSSPIFVDYANPEPSI